MRTTVDLPADVHAVAQAIARDQRRSLSAVLADLVRKGLAAPPAAGTGGSRAGFPLLDLPRTVTTEDVLAVDDE